MPQIQVIKIKDEVSLWFKPKEVEEFSTQVSQIFLEKSSKELQGNIKGYTPEGATGELIKSIQYNLAEPISNPGVTLLTSLIYTEIPYAKDVEMGTPPHEVPESEYDSLMNWVEAKFGSFKLKLRFKRVLSSIRRRGTSVQSYHETGDMGRKMFEHGAEDSKPKIDNYFEQLGKTFLDWLS